jgi:hypothetical protein
MKKKIFNYLLLLIVTGLVLYFSLKDNYKEILDVVSKIDKRWLFIAFFLVVSYWFFKAMAFKSIIRNFKNDYRFRDCFKFILQINFFNAITPFSSGGQPFEIYYLKKEKIKLADVTTIVIEQFVVYQIALVSLGIIAIASNNIFHIFPSNSILKNLVTVGFICNTLITFVLFLLAFTTKTNKFIINKIIHLLNKLKIIRDVEKQEEKFNNYINDLHDGTKKLLENKISFIGMILCNFFGLICLYLIPLTILYSTGDFKSFNGLQCLVASAYVMLIGSFVPIPGGTGGLEYGFIQFYGYFIKGSVLTAIMITWRFITYYIPMIIGAIAVNIKKRG